jgi:ectoine hydroxylase-related dioxygenase (phytanoyl-CoA dioxygenase family)
MTNSEGATMSETALQERLLGVPGGIEVSDEEVQLYTDQIRMNGYTILENALPLDLIERMRDRFDVLLEQRRAAEPSNRGVNRYQMYLPFEEPFAHALVYEHPLVLRILERLMGPDLICTYFASDTPLPGAEYQQVHSDTRLLFPEATLSLPCYGAVMNLPLVDATEENGSMEIWPGGSHLNPGHLDMRRLAAQMHSIRCNMKAGSILVRDLRMWHRGTPHRGTRSRPNMALVYTRNWYRFEQRPFEIRRSLYDALPEHVRRMFRFNTLLPD